MTDHVTHNKEPKRWLDEPRNIDRIVHLLWVLCALLVLAEFFYAKHPYFGFDGWFGFYAVFGFAAYCFIVLSAKRLRPLLWRSENYYGEDAPEADPDTRKDDHRHE